MSGSASRASYEPYARSISQVFAYRSARSRSRLATAMRSTFGDACAAGITFRLMLPVDRMPHVTARAMWTPDLTDVGSRLALTPAEQAGRPKLPPTWERDRPPAPNAHDRCRGSASLVRALDLGVRTDSIVGVGFSVSRAALDVVIG